MVVLCLGAHGPKLYSGKDSSPHQLAVLGCTRLYLGTWIGLEISGSTSSMSTAANNPSSSPSHMDRSVSSGTRRRRKGQKWAISSIHQAGSPLANYVLLSRPSSCHYLGQWSSKLGKGVLILLIVHTHRVIKEAWGGVYYKFTVTRHAAELGSEVYFKQTPTNKHSPSSSFSTVLLPL